MMTDIDAIEPSAPTSLFPDVESLSVEECSAHVNQLRMKLLEDPDLVTNDESLFAIRCMRKVRTTATMKKGSKAAKAALPIPTLDSFLT
jgi:hypothetical protein